MVYTLGTRILHAGTLLRVIGTNRTGQVVTARERGVIEVWDELTCSCVEADAAACVVSRIGGAYEQASVAPCECGCHGVNK